MHTKQRTNEQPRHGNNRVNLMEVAKFSQSNVVHNDGTSFQRCNVCCFLGMLESMLGLLPGLGDRLVCVRDS